jgi:outer membrane protein TolC
MERLRYGPPAPVDKPIALDLFGALEYAIRHAPTYRDRMDEVYLAALDVTLERHLFEPRFFARTGLQFTGNQKPGDYRSALTATANVGVRQRLPYGGEIVAEALVDFVNAINGNVTEGESAQLALSGSIPLLRGAGLTNLEALISSEREVVYTIRTFEDFRRQFAVQVCDQYFDVLTRQQAVNNRRQNVRNLTLLLDRAKALRGAPVGVQGRLNDLEVQRSEQALLEGEQRLLIAQQQYLNSVDNFKLLLGMPIERDLTVTPVALQVNVPDIQTRDVVDLAHRFRLDLQTARDRIDDARRRVQVAKNGLLPDLDLTGRVSAGNRPNDAAHDIDRRTLEYSAGINLDLPVDRVAERNVYRRALIAYHRAERDYEDMEDQVSADVRAAVRAIRLAQFSVDIQRRAISVAERRLEYAFILLQIGGRINARDVVEAQQSLLTAQDGLDVAQADLQVEVLNFLRRTGTLRVDPEAGLIGRAMDRSRSHPDPVDIPGLSNWRGVPVEPGDAAPAPPRRQAPPVPQARGQTIPANRVQ